MNLLNRISASLAVILLLLSASACASPWLPLGPDGGDARKIVADPADHLHLFLGAANGWIFESRDGGGAWKRLARVGKRDDLVIDSIVVDAKDSKHLFVGAWVVDRPDGGLFISKDGGQTWLNQAEMRGQSVRSLAAAPSDSKILVAGTLRGVFRSTDGGARWSAISPESSTEIHEVESVAIDPADPRVIYAGTWHLPWKTSDGGEHWENIKEGLIDDSDVFSIIIDPGSPQVVYASACSGIYKSETAGAVFHKIQGIPSTARRTRVLLQDPGHRDTVFAGTTEGLWRSNDAGKTWTRTTGPDIIVNDVRVDAADSHRVLIATDRGGVLASDDGGDTFHAANGGFSARQITTISTDQARPATVYIGVVNDKEWGGVFQSDDGGVNWQQRSKGLGGLDVFSLGQSADGTLIAGTSHGLFRLVGGADGWEPVDELRGPALPPSHPVLADFVRAPVPVGRNRFSKRLRSGGHATAAGKTKPATRPAARKPRTTAQVAKPLTASHATVHGKAAAVHGKASKPAASQRAAVHPGPHTNSKGAALLAVKPSAPPVRALLDVAVYALARSQAGLLAATTRGLLTSQDEGVSWAPADEAHEADWRYLAAAERQVVAASLRAIQVSHDGGLSWSTVPEPESLTQIAAIAIVPSGQIWVGGREGVFFSDDGGRSWTTPKNLFVNTVTSLFYDAPSQTMLLTNGGYNGLVFSVRLPSQQVSYVDSGWTVRAVRPVGDHLVAATSFDGIVVEPKLVASPFAEDATSPRKLHPESAAPAPKD